MSNKKKLQIGLDIGVTSVGWSLLETNDSNVNIINTGVRMFSDVAEEDTGKLSNEKRRAKRSTRRMISRRKNRKIALVKLLKKYNILDQNENINKYVDSIDITKFGYEIPAQLKVEGLSNKLNSKDKLIFCLYNYISHRGFSFEEYNPDEKVSSKDNDFEKFIKELHRNYHPSQAIVKFYEKYKFYKDSGIQKVHTQQWINEIRDFCKTQELPENFINDYLRLFKSYDYSTGPNVKIPNTDKPVSNPSQYGLYNKETGGFYTTLWDKTTGKCSFYTNEFRGAKNSIFAEVFNLLNDLSNFYMDGDTTNKLSIADRKKIIDNLKKLPKKGIDIKSLFKPVFSGEQIDFIKNNKCGLRIKVDDKNVNKFDCIITPCSNYAILTNWLVENNVISWEDINFLDMSLLDKLNSISDIYFHSKNKEEIEKLVKESIKKLFNKDVDTSNNIPKLKGMSQTHSLSYKAMKEYIEYWNNLNNNLINWQQYQIGENKRKSLNIDNLEISKSKYINKDMLKDIIVSPTTRRAFNQTINVLNKIIKVYSKEYDIDHITIELAREKNTANERKIKTKFTRLNESLVENIKKDNEEFQNLELNNSTKLRMKLWNEQDRCDVYTGDYIHPNMVLSGKDLEIDHIIPISILNDDSQKNKVLCYRGNNSDKKNRTPYEWLSTKGKFDDFKTRVLNLKNMSKIKKDLLLNTDITSINSGFVARQLVDTRYACVAVKETLEKFFDNNPNFDNKPLINNVRGGVTSFFKKCLKIKNNVDSENIKDREEYNHHAIDACVIAYLGSDYNMNKRFSFSESYNRYEQNKYQNKDSRLIIDSETGEVIIDFDDDYFVNLNENKKLKDFKNQIENRIANKQFAFSRMLESKSNTEISNETIYSVKWNENPNTKKIVEGQKYTYLNLVSESTNLEKLLKYFGPKPKDVSKLVCYKEDKILYDKLNTIFNRYYSPSKKNNPFIEFMKEEFKDIPETNITFVQLDLNNPNTRIKKLKIEDAKINNENVILLNKHNKNKGSKSIPVMTSLKCIFTRIYKNDDGKHIACPINILVTKLNNNKLIIDDDKLNLFLSRNKISNKNKFVDLKYGTTLINKETKEIFYSIGSCTNGYIELKNIARKIERNQVALNTVIKNYDLCEIDTLGKIIKIKDWNL